MSYEKGSYSVESSVVFYITYIYKNHQYNTQYDNTTKWEGVLENPCTKHRGKGQVKFYPYKQGCGGGGGGARAETVLVMLESGEHKYFGVVLYNMGA